jgi:hypothetical protein
VQISFIHYIIYFSCYCDQPPDRNNIREERFILLRVSEATVHHGGEGMVEQLTSSWPGSMRKRNTGRSQGKI